jgi:hypothetical protein
MYNGKSGQHPAAVERSKRRAEYGLAPQGAQRNRCRRAGTGRLPCCCVLTSIAHGRAELEHGASARCLSPQSNLYAFERTTLSFFGKIPMSKGAIFLREVTENAETHAAT